MPTAVMTGKRLTISCTEKSRRHRDRPPTRSPRRPDLRIARPQGRDDDHRRDGDVRLRPNRPGPSRTERRLEIDLELKTTYETRADRLLGQAISQLGMSRKSVLEIHVSLTALCELRVKQTELRPDRVVEHYASATPASALSLRHTDEAPTSAAEV
jgi:hypothetical protein